MQPIGSSGWCLVVEEFSPSVAVMRCDPRGADCGTVHTRYVPEGSDVLEGDAYAVIASLPSELAFRIPNRCARCPQRLPRYPLATVPQGLPKNNRSNGTEKAAVQVCCRRRARGSCRR